MPRQRAAHAVGGPQPSPQPRLRVQIPRPTPVSRASPLHRRTACSLRRKWCDCSFISPAVCPRSPGLHPQLSCSRVYGCGLWPLQAPRPLWLSAASGPAAHAPVPWPEPLLIQASGSRSSTPSTLGFTNTPDTLSGYHGLQGGSMVCVCVCVRVHGVCVRACV